MCRNMQNSQISNLKYMGFSLPNDSLIIATKIISKYVRNLTGKLLTIQPPEMT